MKFTKVFMLHNSGCYDYVKLMNCSFMKDEEITAESILNSEIPLKDKFWFFCRKVFSKTQNQNLAVKLAKTVLPIWEEKYPEDKRPHKVIEAAVNYLKNSITVEELNEAINECYNAYMDATYTCTESIANAAESVGMCANCSEEEEVANCVSYVAAVAVIASINHVNIQNQLLEIIKSFVNES